MTKNFLILASAAVVALSACTTGTDEPEGNTPAPSVTVTDTATQATETSTPADPTTEVSIPTETSTPADPTTPPASTDPTGEPGVPDVADFTVVDNAAFLQGSNPEQLMFKSPSGNLFCGILEGEQMLAGCQSIELVDNLPDCDDPDGGHGPMITFDFDAPAEAGCAHEGIFVGLNPKVLEYGQAVEYMGATCMSEESGVTCLDDATGEGFKAAREGFVPTS